MVWADLVAGLVVYEGGWGRWAWRTGGMDIIEGMVGLVVFTLMPALWMFGEGITYEMWEPQTAYEHEKEKFFDAM